MSVRLVLFDKDGNAKPLKLGSGVTVLGRSNDCDIRVRHLSISKKHCQISNHDCLVTIKDLGSRNGTFVNEEKVEMAELKDSDVIKAGALKMVIRIREFSRDPKKATVYGAEGKNKSGVSSKTDAGGKDVEAIDGILDDFFAKHNQ